MMTEDLPIYKVDFNPEDLTQGVYGVSLVDEPAIGLDFIALSENKSVEIKLANAEKQTVVGPVLIPNQKIYRNQNGKEFYLTFDAPTIELLSQEFLKRGFHKNSFYNHDESERIDLSVVESWITGDTDKSKSLGYDLPVGTWMLSMKLEDDAWKDYVKSGKVKGFSIDSFLDMRQIQMTKLKKAHSQYVKMLEETNSIKIDGVEVHYTGALEEGTFLTDKEGNPVQASFEYQDFRYTTNVDGKIVEIDEVKQINENMEEGQPVTPEAAEAVSSVLEHISEIVEVLESAGMDVTELKAKLGMKPKEELKEEEKMAEEPKEEEMKKEEMEEEEEVKMEKEEDEEMVEMKKRIEALEEKLKVAEDENTKLKKSPAATKLSQVIPVEVKQKESAMDVISRLAKMSAK